MVENSCFEICGTLPATSNNNNSLISVHSTPLNFDGTWIVLGGIGEGRGGEELLKRNVRVNQPKKWMNDRSLIKQT